MPTLAASQIQAPGVYISELAPGATPEIATFNRLYLLGTASQLAAGRVALRPYQVASLEDFINQFGGSSAVILNTLEYAFKFYPNAQIYYAAVQEAAQKSIAITLPVVEGAYSLTFTGGGLTAPVTATYTAAGGATAQQIITSLLTAINDNPALNNLLEIEAETTPAGAPTYTNGLFFVRAKLPVIDLPAVSSTSNMQVTDRPANDPPTATDWTYAVENSFDEDLFQGYLCVPEAYYNLTKQGDRTAVQQAAELLVSQQEYNWISIVDSGNPAVLDDPDALLTEREFYTSLRGHSWYVGAWPKDSDNDWISPAVLQAIVALKRNSIEGFVQPPAGTRYPLVGLSALPYSITTAQHSTLNQVGINQIRQIRNRGLCVYGARTLSVNAIYKFCNTRVILNVYARSLYDTLAASDLVFTTIDGEGVLFNRVKAVADELCYRLWEAGALFGASPEDAFLNICDRRNNPNLDLQSGAVQLTSYVTTSPTGERILADIAPIPIGSLAAYTS
jgi:hypothetical protein